MTRQDGAAKSHGLGLHSVPIRPRDKSCKDGEILCMSVFLPSKKMPFRDMTSQLLFFSRDIHYFDLVRIWILGIFLGGCGKTTYRLFPCILFSTTPRFPFLQLVLSCDELLEWQGSGVQSGQWPCRHILLEIGR